MSTVLLLGATLVVATKALDCLSTLRAIRSPTCETNPIARALMRRLGIGPSVALVFVLASFWTAALAALALRSGSQGIQAIVASNCLLVALVQGAVAHTNWTGQWNVVTRVVLRVHRGGG